MIPQQGRSPSAPGSPTEDLCARLDRLDRAWALRAAQEYTELKHLLERLPVEELLADTDLGILLCTAWHRTGELGRALDLVRQLAASCEARGNDRLYRERMNLEAIILIALCDYAGAEPLLYEVLDASSRAGDDLFLGNACTNLGSIEVIRCDWDLAISNFKRALVCFQRIGYLRGIGANYHNLGLAYHWMGQRQEAEDHVIRASHYLRSHGSDDELGLLEIERTELLVESHDIPLAKAMLRRAESRLLRIGHESLYADVLRMKGIISLKEGHALDAEKFFARSLQMARATSNRLVEGWVLTEVASMAASQGEVDHAEARLQEAIAVFIAMGAPERARQSEARIRSILLT